MKHILKAKKPAIIPNSSTTRARSGQLQHRSTSGGPIPAADQSTAVVFTSDTSATGVQPPASTFIAPVPIDPVALQNVIRPPKRPSVESTLLADDEVIRILNSVRPNSYSVVPGHAKGGRATHLQQQPPARKMSISPAPNLSVIPPINVKTPNATSAENNTATTNTTSMGPVPKVSFQLQASMGSMYPLSPLPPAKVSSHVNLRSTSSSPIPGIDGKPKPPPRGLNPQESDRTLDGEDIEDETFPLSPPKTLDHQQSILHRGPGGVTDTEDVWITSAYVELSNLKKPKIRDPFEFIEKLKKSPKGTKEFVYLKPINSAIHVSDNGAENNDGEVMDKFTERLKSQYNPYHLEIVEYSEIDPAEGYFTLSLEVKKNHLFTLSYMQ
jgi:hypothetical protein